MTDEDFNKNVSKMSGVLSWREKQANEIKQLQKQLDFLENIIENALTYQGDDFYDNICQLNQDYKAYQKEFSEGKEQ